MKVCRLLMSLCENYQQPLPSVMAQYRRSSKLTALPSRDQRERSMRTVFTQTLTRAVQNRDREEAGRVKE
jgi:hypothetical protein